MDGLCIGANGPLTVETLLPELKPWQIETEKAKFLDYLYVLYDRDNAERPLCHTYTGLWQRFAADMGEISRAGFISAQ